MLISLLQWTMYTVLGVTLVFSLILEHSNILRCFSLFFLAVLCFDFRFVPKTLPPFTTDVFTILTRTLNFPPERVECEVIKMSEPENNTFALILAAAGRSLRFSRRGSSDSAVKKVFTHLGGKPVWLRSVEKFVSREDVAQVIIVVAPEDIDWFRKYYLSEINRMLLRIVMGGENRVDSIRNGLAVVSPKVGYVAVHDAARPCVADQEIATVFKAARKHGAALLAAPMVGTIKRVVDSLVEETVPREHFWEAQTPQVFRRDLILEAYQQTIKDVPTDDAQLVERLGHPVHIVPSDSGNIKITTQSDLILAKHLVENGR